VRSREKDSNRSNDGEEREDEEANPVHDHGGKFPIGDQIILVLPLLKLGRDKAQFPDDSLQVSLRLVKTNQSIFKYLIRQ